MMQPLIDSTFGGDIHATDVRGDTPLHYAAQHENLDLVLALISRGAVVDARNRHHQTPLHFATSVPIAEALLGAGAHIDAQDWLDCTPLLRLTQERAAASACACLVNHGANVNLIDHGEETALHHAVRSNQAAVIEKLIGAQANLEMRNHHGRTPLALAAYLGMPVACRLLVDAGANPTPVNQRGRSILMEARDGLTFSPDEASRIEVLQMIEAALERRQSQAAPTPGQRILRP